MGALDDFIVWNHAYCIERRVAYPFISKIAYLYIYGKSQYTNLWL